MAINVKKNLNGTVLNVMVSMMTLWEQKKMTKCGKKPTKTTIKKEPTVFHSVGDYMKHWRVKNGFTQSALGSLIGYSFQMISDMETGRKYSERYCVMLMSAMKAEDEMILCDLMKQQTVEAVLRRA